MVRLSEKALKNWWYNGCSLRETILEKKYDVFGSKKLSKKEIIYIYIYEQISKERERERENNFQVLFVLLDLK